jgi:hypothetical protein
VSREQDQRLVEAYERVAKGEQPKLEEKKFNAKWFATRAKHAGNSVKDLQDAINKKDTNAVNASLAGIESQLSVMKEAIKNVSEGRLDEKDFSVKNDVSGEKSGFVQSIHRRAVELMTYKLISRQDVDKIVDCVKKVLDNTRPSPYGR